MGRGRVKMKLKRKARVLCDFCGFSRLHEQDHEAVSMEGDHKRLRLLTRRMTCKDLDGLSFAELLLLESRLEDALLIVEPQRKKIKELEEDERLRKQEAVDTDDGMKRQVLVPCKFSSSSSGERQDHEAPLLSKIQIEFERRNAESMEIQFERLWLLNERMNGRELDGMNSAELDLLENQIKRGVLDLHEQRFAPTMEIMARRGVGRENKYTVINVDYDDQTRRIAFYSSARRAISCEMV